MSDTNEQQELVVEKDKEAQELQPPSPTTDTLQDDDAALDNNAQSVDVGLTKAVETYRKIVETDELTEEQKQELEKKIKEIEEREIIEDESKHEPKELTTDKNKILIGPPTLTRFEKARIMGARALQLSLGAPPFIQIPATARTSLDIAMVELDGKVIPIVIRRALPNGDYQNIPITYFK